MASYPAYVIHRASQISTDSNPTWRDSSERPFGWLPGDRYFHAASSPAYFFTPPEGSHRNTSRVNHSPLASPSLRNDKDCPTSPESEHAPKPAIYGPPLSSRDGTSSVSKSRPAPIRSTTAPRPPSSSHSHFQQQDYIYASSEHLPSSLETEVRPSAHRSSTLPAAWPRPSAHHQPIESSRLAYLYDDKPLPRLPSAFSPPSSRTSSSRSSGHRHSQDRSSYSSHASTPSLVSHNPCQASDSGSSRSKFPGSSPSRRDLSRSSASTPQSSPLRNSSSQYSFASTRGSVSTEASLASHLNPLADKYQKAQVVNIGPLPRDCSNEPGYEEMDGLIDVCLAVEKRTTAKRRATDYVWLLTWPVGRGKGHRILRLHWQNEGTHELGYYFGPVTQNVDDPVIGVDSAASVQDMHRFAIGKLDRAQREELERITTSLDAKAERAALSDNISWIDQVLKVAVARGLFTDHAVRWAMMQGRGTLG